MFTTVVPAFCLLSPEESLEDCFARQGKVLGHIAEKTGQCSNPERRVAGDGDVVLAAFVGGQPEVTACLTGYAIAQIGDGFCEVVARDVPRKPQALMTSSRTKWSRMTFGAFPSSK